MFDSKDSLRIHSKEVRKKLDVDKISSKMLSVLKKWNFYEDSKVVMLYYPINTEYNFLDLLNDSSKTYLFPKMSNGDIDVIEYNQNLGFKIGDYGIKEPVGLKFENYSQIDLIIAPALCASKDGFRIGYGKGCYDRFFNLVATTKTIVPVYSSLLYEHIPTEKHDIPVNFILTEESIISCD